MQIANLLLSVPRHALPMSRSGMETGLEKKLNQPIRGSPDAYAYFIPAFAHTINIYNTKQKNICLIRSRLAQPWLQTTDSGGAILLMLSGGVMIAYSNSMYEQAGWTMPGEATGKAVSAARSLAEKVDVQKLKRALKITVASVALFFVLVICLFVFGQNYFKARDTRVDAKEISLALEEYKQQHQAYPDNLNTLIGKNPLRAAWQHDRWGHAYQYNISANGLSYTLRSAGKDGAFDNGDDIVVK